MNYIKRLVYSMKGVEYLKKEDVLKIDDLELLRKIHFDNRYEDVRQLAAFKMNNIMAEEEKKDTEKLLMLEKKGTYEEYINTLKKVNLYSKIDMIRNLENETWLQKIAIGEFDSYVAHAAIMRIQDVDFLIEIISEHKWDSSNIGNVGILRMIDFEITEKIRNFLDSIKDSEGYARDIRSIAKALLKNPQLVRDVKSEKYNSRCDREPDNWALNVASRLYNI